MGRTKSFIALVCVCLVLLATLVVIPACQPPSTTPTPGTSPTATPTGVTKVKMVWNAMGAASADDQLKTLEMIKRWNDAIAQYNYFIDVEPHYGWELFPGTQSIEALSRNTIQMTGTLGYSEEDFEPRFAISSMPALFDGWEHANRFYKTPEWQKVEADQKAKGTMIIYKTYYDMYLGIKNKPGTLVTTLEGLKGLRIRTMESPTMQSGMTALGTKPIIVSMNELTFAMQTGMIDGLIHARGVSWFNMLRYHEFMNQSIHFPISTVPSGTAVSTEWFNKLPKTVQDALWPVTEWRVSVYRSTQDADNAASMDLMAKSNVTQTDLAPAEYDRWIAALEPARKMVAAKVGQGLMDAVERSRKAA